MNIQDGAEDAPQFVSFCDLVLILTRAILVRTMRFENTREVEVNTLPEELQKQGTKKQSLIEIIGHAFILRTLQRVRQLNSLN